MEDSITVPVTWQPINTNVSCSFFSNNCRTDADYVDPTYDPDRGDEIPVLPSHFNILVLVTMVIMDAIGSYMNILGLAVLLKSNLPKSTSDILVTNIAVSDFLSAVLVYPICILSVASQDWALGHTSCVWYAFGFPFFGVVSINTMTAIAAERYLTVTKRTQSWRVARLQSIRCLAAVWICALLVAVPNIVLLTSTSTNISHLRSSICNLEVEEGEQSIYDIAYPIYFMMVCLMTPVSITTYCYCRLYFMVRHVARRVRFSRMSVIAMAVPGTGGTMAATAGRTPRASTTLAPQDEVKTERVIAKRMMFMVIVTFVSWLPYTMMEIAVIGLHYRFPLALRILPSVFAKGCIIYNPLIYIAFSKKFKTAFKDYLRCRWTKKTRVGAVRPGPQGGGNVRPRDIRMERSSFMRQQTFPLLNTIREMNDPEHGARYLDPGGNTTSGYGTASMTPSAYPSRTPVPSTCITFITDSHSGHSTIMARSPAKISLPETQMRTAVLLRKDTEETFNYIHENRPQPRRKNGTSTLQVPSQLVVPSSHRQIKVDLGPPLPGVPDCADSHANTSRSDLSELSEHPNES